MEDTLINIREAANVFSLSANTIRRFIHPQGIRPYGHDKKRGNLFRLSELAEFFRPRPLDERGASHLPPRTAGQKLRQRVLERDKNQCRYCGKVITGRDAQIDHVVPYQYGGDTEEHNMVAACANCNRTKGNCTPEEAGMALLPTPK